MKNKTTFQTIVNEAQPTPVENAKSFATSAAVFTVASVGIGIEATIGVFVAVIDWWVNVVDAAFDLTH